MTWKITAVAARGPGSAHWTVRDLDRGIAAELELSTTDPDPEVSVEFWWMTRGEKPKVDHRARAEAARLYARAHDEACDLEALRVEPELDGPIADLYGPDAAVVAARFFGSEVAEAIRIWRRS